MHPKLDLKSTGQHWKKNGEYWCSFDYYGQLTLVKCCWSNKTPNCLIFEMDPGKEQCIKGVSTEWFDDAEYFYYTPKFNFTWDEFQEELKRPRKRIYQ